ncbi:MAG TPA: MgtC/SapB family protein, partial [Steroidobacteraceae bacterium]|nr:MgtC/SapB family protein [Steroidobacteraceae bacterium]
MIPEGTLLGLAAALGGGLLIGIERERRKGPGPQRALAGVRTFALVALAGAGCELIGHPLLVILGAVLIVALAAIGYWRRRSADPGVTTAVALF